MSRANRHAHVVVRGRATSARPHRLRRVSRSRRATEPAGRSLFDAVRAAGRAASVELDPLYERWQRTGAVLMCTLEFEHEDATALVQIDDAELSGREFLGLLAEHRGTIAVVFLDD